MTGSNPKPLLCVPVIATTDTLMVKAVYITMGLRKFWIRITILKQK